MILNGRIFNGMLGDTESGSSFPMLRVIDLSQNNFSGQLPSQVFLQKITNASRLVYMDTVIRLSLGSSLESRQSLSCQMPLYNRGKKLQYDKILEFFVAMDLSGNGFTGEIPTSIGNLYGLHMLNLSNNALSGRIPTFLGNLTRRELLDLSRNNLIGQIPQQLTQLNFLAVSDVSENNLTGPIPRGKQVDNNSYVRNTGLCGKPLWRKCGNSEALPSSTSRLEESQERRSLFEFGWRPVVIGYDSGLLVGLMIEHVVVTWRNEWFMKTFRVNPQRRTRNSNRRRRN